MGRLIDSRKSHKTRRLDSQRVFSAQWRPTYDRPNRRGVAVNAVAGYAELSLAGQGKSRLDYSRLTARQPQGMTSPWQGMARLDRPIHLYIAKKMMAQSLLSKKMARSLQWADPYHLYTGKMKRDTCQLSHRFLPTHVSVQTCVNFGLRHKDTCPKIPHSFGYNDCIVFFKRSIVLCDRSNRPNKPFGV